MGPWSPGRQALGCTSSVTTCVAYAQSGEERGGPRGGQDHWAWRKSKDGVMMLQAVD